VPGCKILDSAAKALVIFPQEEEGLCDRLETKQGVLDTVAGSSLVSVEAALVPPGRGQGKDGITARVAAPGYLVNYASGPCSPLPWAAEATSTCL
jgi:hypothetical protein